MATASPELLARIADERAKHKDKRVWSFEFEQQKYWIKQQEKPKGVERLLKPFSKKAFQKELAHLQALSEKNAPVVELVASGDDFMVLLDGGISASQWIEDNQQGEAFADNILRATTDALVSLHSKNLIHGRPALRDMVCQLSTNDETAKVLVQFVDFENAQSGDNLRWKKVRDSLIYIHSIARSEPLSIEQTQKAIADFQSKADPAVWNGMLDWINRYRLLYGVLSLFKLVARTDLKAIYVLFEQLTPYCQARFIAQRRNKSPKNED